MATPPPAADVPPYQPQSSWQVDSKDAALGEREQREHSNGAANGSDPLAPYPTTRDSALVPAPSSDAGKDSAAGRGDKQVKPNKVYIGGLPEHTRQDDLRSCFSKIGNVVNIELKLGYGFVEFETSEAALESVAKYNDGFFMGNKIRVEMSHGGGRTAKYSGDPGACFKCGTTGHWARECPNHPAPAPPPRRPAFADPYADYPPPRDPYARDPYREDYARYPPPPPPPRDSRYGYDYPPPRDYRRPLTPPRDYRDYPAPRPARDYDDYKARPPPPKPYYPSEPPYSRSYDPPPARDVGLDRRVPPADRYGSYGPPVPRPRTPPGAPPGRVRDDYERPPPRDYPDYRGRTPPPPVSGSVTGPSGRYSDYPPRSGGSEQSRRRSQSPPRTGSSGYRSGQYSDAGGYPPSGGAYSPSAGFSGNGYSAASAIPPPPRSTGGGREREYSRGSIGDSGYSRRP